MAYEPILNEDGKEIDLQELVTAASIDIMLERRKEATNLIKGFLIKVEGLTKEIKNLENQLKTKQESLAKTNEKIQRLKKGEWNILAENNSGSKPDSESK